MTIWLLCLAAYWLVGVVSAVWITTSLWKMDVDLSDFLFIGFLLWFSWPIILPCEYLAHRPLTRLIVFRAKP